MLQPDLCTAYAQLPSGGGPVSDSTSPAAAEYARLLAEAAQAGARLKDLGASYPDRDNTGAWEAHKAQEGDASDAFFNAQYAADAYLREHPDAVPVYGAACRWQGLGVSTIPVKSDGSKSPLVKWKQYQGTLPPEDELWKWHHGGRSGLAVLTGRRGGGGVEMASRRALRPGRPHRAAGQRRRPPAGDVRARGPVGRRGHLRQVHRRHQKSGPRRGLEAHHRRVLGYLPRRRPPVLVVLRGRHRQHQTGAAAQHRRRAGRQAG
jgi:hypothetical protein